MTKKMKLFLNILIAILVIIGGFLTVESILAQPAEQPPGAAAAQAAANTGAAVTSDIQASAPAGRFLLQIIDCGQGDSILAKSPEGGTVLIDAGDTGTKDKILPQLKKQGVTTIDLLVATHPHADHIGSMQAILENYKVNKVLLTDATHTTNTYLKILETVKSLKIPKVIAKAGDTMQIGGIGIEILGPVKKYDDLNDMSVVLRLTYGKSAFVLTGDAEKESENDILKKFSDLHADVLKIGHHGSETSTGKSFLAAVAPKYAAISVGKGNDYGHPHKPTLNLLNKNRIAVYRTDLSGNIFFYSDGETVTVQTERE